MQVKIQITATQTLETENYRDEWEATWDEDGHEEGNDYPEIPVEFCVKRLQSALENGELGLDDVLDPENIAVVALP